MQFQIEELSEIRRKVSLTIEKEVVDTEREKFLYEAQKQVTVPGYRKGQAPVQLVESKLGDLTNTEVSTRIITHAVQDFLRDSELHVAGDPVISEEHRPTPTNKTIGQFNIDGTFSVDLEVDLVPELDPKNYVGLEVSEKPDTEKWISIALRDIQDQFSTLETVEGKAEAGHHVTVEYPDTDLETLEVKDDFTSCFVGVSADTKVTVDHPEKGNVEVVVHSVDKKEYPEVNDELAQMSGYEDLEALKRDLLVRAEAEHGRTVKARALDEMIPQLIEANPFPLPTAWKNYKAKEVAMRLNIKEIKDEETLKFVLDLAERNARSAFILERIYDKEDSIHLTEDELYTLLQTEAKQNGMDVDEYLTQLKQTGRYEGFISFHQQMRATNFLVDKSVLKEKVND